MKIRKPKLRIIKADHNACHRLCSEAKSAPRYGGLVPLFHAKKL